MCVHVCMRTRTAALFLTIMHQISIYIPCTLRSSMDPRHVIHAWHCMHAHLYMRNKPLALLLTQEGELRYMLAFREPARALEWCLVMQVLCKVQAQ